MTERTVHVGVECPRLRQIVDVHLLEELYFLHFLHFGERFPRLRIEVIRVLERTLMVGGVVGFHLRRVFVLLVVRRRDREVSRVVEHVAFLGVDVHFQAAYGERCGLVYRIGHLFDGVAFCLRLIGAERLAQFNIRVKRVIVRTCGLVAIRYIERHLYLRLLREQTSAFQRSAHAHLIEIIQIAVKHVGLNRTIACGLQTTGYIQLCNVANR